MFEDPSNLACNAACIFVLVGVVFQLKCRVMWRPIVQHLKDHHAMAHTDDVHWGGLVSHSMWILGVIVMTLGLVGLNLSLGLSAPLAITAAVQAPMASLAYMVIVGSSPMGLPGVHGPPIPPRIMLCIAELAMVYAFFKNAQAGMYDKENLNVFYGMTAVSAAVPQLTSLIHRSAVAKSVQKTA